METEGKKVSGGASASLNRVRAAVRAYGLQKQLALDAGMSDSLLSKYLDEQLPRLCLLLDVLGLEITARGHVDDLRRVLKEVL
jgi:hypothetical protein